MNKEGEDGEGAGSEAPSLLSYTLRYVSEEVDDGEGAGSEAPSMMSYTLRYESYT